MDIITIIPVQGIPIVKQGDDIAEKIMNAAESQGTPIMEGDVIVVTHVIVSRAEGNTVKLKDVVPSEFAKAVAEQYGKDPAIVEVVLRESRNIIRMGDGHIISETRHGFICANAGVDRSNVSAEDIVALLPKDPDLSARRIRQEIKERTGKDVAVIVSDTHGRALRNGAINVALGVAGMRPIWDRRGESDLFGYTLRVKQTAIADELSSAAELVIGQAGEGIPVAIIRGYAYPRSEEATAKDLIRPKEKALFV